MIGSRSSVQQAPVAAVPGLHAFRIYPLHTEFYDRLDGESTLGGFTLAYKPKFVTFHSIVAIAQG